MITDLNPDIDKTSVGTYINGLVIELDKLYIALSRDTALGSQEKASVVDQLRDYIRVTQVYPDKPRGEEPPKEEIPG